MWVKKGVPVSEDVPPVAVKPNSSVSVHSPRGDVTVFADEQTDLRVVATKTVSAVNDAESEKRGQEVKIEITPVSGGFRVEPSGITGDRSHTRVDLEIHLPKQVSVTAQTDSGDITITGVSGSVTALSQRGDVAIHDVASDVTATMQNGDVRIEHVHGDVHLHGKGQWRGPQRRERATQRLTANFSAPYKSPASRKPRNLILRGPILRF